MTNPTPHEVTQLLAEWSSGDESALGELLPLVEKELHRLAHHYMSRERPGHTLQTTALINEAYLRLVHGKQKHFQNRAHFFAVAANLMRQIMVDHARARQSAKRGGGVVKVSLDEGAVVSDERAAELIALDEALHELMRAAPRQGRVVELRYFGGLSVEETAEVLKLHPNTILNDWREAKAWLYFVLNESETS
ncbi:MAG TPA: sigma-70 family RNA polymerase sigma factor [Pyrinomonadaceae bacterium]|nr:sigma-70 family RNA polymerase sigma factor [Pyrinomonadaceae bacterium]